MNGEPMADPITRETMIQARREAQLVLLEAIKAEKYNPTGQAHLAEAYALIEGTLTAQPPKDA